MWHRLLRLFDRYCARYLVVCGPRIALRGDAGGWVQLIRRGNRLELVGQSVTGVQTQARQGPAQLPLILICGEDRLACNLHRDPPGTSLSGRVLLDLPFSPLPLQLCQEPPAGTLTQALPPLSVWAIRRARAALLPGFGLRLLRALPLVLRWRISRDLALRPQIRAALGFDGVAVARPLSAALFAQAPAETSPSGGLAAQDASAGGAITCILPVYNAFDLLPEVLERLCRHTDLPWHALIIEDCSTDPAVRPFLRSWAGAQNARLPGCVTLLENAQNLGFLGSVNRGLALALPRGAPVVLLNADALLPAGWARRLIAPLLQDPHVASCTPLSNEAELFSVPVICARQDLAAGQADLMDAAAQRFVPGAGDASAPTGVGFCMALHPDWLAQVPQFDTVFAPGYGEEVDWCQKTRALGARHVGVANLFVEHRGGASFGSTQKQRLIAAHSDLISARYPKYDIDVQDYLRTDPMLTPRLALALVWVGLQAQAAGAALPVYLTHTMRGGVEYHQKQLIAADIARIGAALVLRVGGAARWRLELHSATGVTQGETGDFALIQQLLQPLDRRRLVYVCGVGDSDPVTLPDHLLALCRDSDALEVQFHDYFALSPSFNLLNDSGRFDGVPAADNRNPAHQGRRPDGSAVPLAQWRAAWGRLVARADRLVVFSQDSRQHVVQAWPELDGPELDGRLVVLPHQLHHNVPRLTPREGARPVVAVLGNLNRPKGAALLAALGAALAADRRRGDLQILVLGDIDPSEPRHPAIAVLGEYKLAELPLLVKRHQITAWLIPSLCPETFSFTTHEALATGLPVFCLDLGAQAEALRAAPGQGHIIARADSLQHQAAAILACLRRVLCKNAKDPG